MRMRTAVLMGLMSIAGPTLAAEPWKAFTDGNFAWKASGPLVTPQRETNPPQVSIKDPTVIYHQGRWHVFTSVRFGTGRHVDIQYLNFRDWREADQAPRYLLNLHDQYYCAPQVFYFRPQKKWYLLFQMADKAAKQPFGPACSTTTDIADPKSWSKPKPIFPDAPPEQKWLDFWVICDDAKAHLLCPSGKREKAVGGAAGMVAGGEIRDAALPTASRMRTSAGSRRARGLAGGFREMPPAPGRGLWRA